MTELPMKLGARLAQTSLVLTQPALLMISKLRKVSASALCGTFAPLLQVHLHELGASQQRCPVHRILRCKPLANGMEHLFRICQKLQVMPAGVSFVFFVHINGCPTNILANPTIPKLDPD
jgi:hypothetical protein